MFPGSWLNLSQPIKIHTRLHLWSCGPNRAASLLPVTCTNSNFTTFSSCQVQRLLNCPSQCSTNTGVTESLASVRGPGAKGAGAPRPRPEPAEGSARAALRAAAAAGAEGADRARRQPIARLLPSAGAAPRAHRPPAGAGCGPALTSRPDVLQATPRGVRAAPGSDSGERRVRCHSAMGGLRDRIASSLPS